MLPCSFVWLRLFVRRMFQPLFTYMHIHLSVGGAVFLLSLGTAGTIIVPDVLCWSLKEILYQSCITKAIRHSSGGSALLVKPVVAVPLLCSTSTVRLW
jgi:hypothetical protein